jgi:hypothetical protein
LYFKGFIEIRQVLPLPLTGITILSAIDKISSSLDSISSTLVENKAKIAEELFQAGNGGYGRQNKYEVCNKLILFSFRRNSFPALARFRDIVLLGLLAIVGQKYFTSGETAAAAVGRHQILFLALIMICAMLTIVINYTLMVESSFLEQDAKRNTSNHVFSLMKDICTNLFRK